MIDKSKREQYFFELVTPRTRRLTDAQATMLVLGLAPVRTITLAEFRARYERRALPPDGPSIGADVPGGGAV